MKFGTCLDYVPGKLFSYGATGSKTCVSVGSHFFKMASNTHLRHRKRRLLRQCKADIDLALPYYAALNYHIMLQRVYMGVCAPGDIQKYADSAK